MNFMKASDFYADGYGTVLCCMCCQPWDIRQPIASGGYVCDNCSDHGPGGGDENATDE